MLKKIYLKIYIKPILISLSTFYCYIAFANLESDKENLSTLSSGITSLANVSLKKGGAPSAEKPISKSEIENLIKEYTLSEYKGSKEKSDYGVLETNVSNLERTLPQSEIEPIQKRLTAVKKIRWSPTMKNFYQMIENYETDRKSNHTTKSLCPRLDEIGNAYNKLMGQITQEESTLGKELMESLIKLIKEQYEAIKKDYENLKTEEGKKGLDLSECLREELTGRRQSLEGKEEESEEEDNEEWED